MLRPGWNITKSADYTHAAYICGLQRREWSSVVTCLWAGQDLRGQFLAVHRDKQVSVLFPRLPVALGFGRDSTHLAFQQHLTKFKTSLGPQPSSINPPQTQKWLFLPFQTWKIKDRVIPLPFVNLSEFTYCCVTCDECIVFLKITVRSMMNLEFIVKEKWKVASVIHWDSRHELRVLWGKPGIQSH